MSELRLPVGEIIFLLRKALFKALEDSKDHARIGRTVPGLIVAITLMMKEEHPHDELEDLQGELGYQVAKVWDALREGATQSAEQILTANLLGSELGEYLGL